MNLPAEMKKLNISEEAREFSNTPPAFIFGSTGKVNNVFQKKNLNTTMRYNQENQPVNTGQARQESASASVMPAECEVWRLRYYYILTQTASFEYLCF